MTLPLNILLIDACASTRSVVATLVRSAGHSVILAEDGAMALELLDSQSPDLILVEAELPDIGGAELVRRLSRHARVGDAFIFTISAATAEARAVMAEVEIHGWLAKPLCRESLMRLVEAVAWSRSSTAAVADADRPARVAA